MEATHTLMGPYLTITLESREVYPKDPGSGIPAVVTASSGVWGSYEAARNTGLLIMHPAGLIHPLTETQLEWLDGQEEFVEEFITYWTKEKSR